MRNLAFRFVRTSTNLSVVETPVHVIDPHLDLRYLFDSSTALDSQLQQRKLKQHNLDSIHAKYNKWWSLYERHQQCGEEEKKNARADLLDVSDGLVEALKLPNLLDKTHFIDAVAEQEVVCDEFKATTSVMDSMYRLEQVIFDHFDATRIDPPRMVRPAVTEAFNYKPSEVIRFHDNNPAMHLVGVTPPGLVVSFVSTKFGSTNTFPIVFLAKGAGYDRKYRGWQKQLVSMMVVSKDEQSLHLKLAEIAQFLSKILPGSEWTKLGPECLRLYESSAASLRTEKTEQSVARILSTGDYISRRLGVIGGAGEFLNVGFVEIDVALLVLKENE